jgi:hypothetical protein
VLVDQFQDLIQAGNIIRIIVIGIQLPMLGATDSRLVPSRECFVFAIDQVELLLRVDDQTFAVIGAANQPLDPGQASIGGFFGTVAGIDDVSAAWVSRPHQTALLLKPLELARSRPFKLVPQVSPSVTGQIVSAHEADFFGLHEIGFPGA